MQLWSLSINVKKKKSKKKAEFKCREVRMKEFGIPLLYQMDLHLSGDFSGLWTET